MKYFAYGSNMNFRHMRKRCPESSFVGRGYIKDHKFVFDGKSSNWPGFACANIVPCEGEEVWGGIFEISGKDLKSLDKYEHYPINYGHGKLLVLGGHEKIESLVYLREPQEEGPARKEYLEMILEGARDCGLPEEYINFLEKQPAKEPQKVIR